MPGLTSLGTLPVGHNEKGLCHCLFRLVQLPLSFPTSAVTQLKGWAVVQSGRDMLESIPCRELQIASNCLKLLPQAGFYEIISGFS